MPLIVGIDLSTTSTGVCVYNPDLGATHAAQIDGHHPGCHTGERCRRIACAVNEELTRSNLLEACDNIEVFIEAPLGPMQGFGRDLPILYWSIIMNLEDDKFLYPTIYPVSSATLKKFVTGRGNAKPEDKVVAVSTKYKDLIPLEFRVSPETKGGIMLYKDMYDAIGLAVLGHCVLCGDGFTKGQIEAVKKITRL
jgi:hypothetical protein